MIGKLLRPMPQARKKVEATSLPDNSHLPSQAPIPESGLDAILPNRSFAVIGAITIAVAAAFVVRTIYTTLHAAIAALIRVR